MKDELSGAEMAVLSLLGEAPRHGYEIEQLIEERGLREWTSIGFSSIYFLLGRLEKRGLAAPLPGQAGGKARRAFAITDDGRERLVQEALRAMEQPARTYPDLLLGMANWPALADGAGKAALESRVAAIRDEMQRLVDTRDAADTPDFVQAMFDYALGQLAADEAWSLDTIRKLEADVEKIDFRKTNKELFNPPKDKFVAVEVPRMQFVKLDGEGNPNTAPSYKAAIEWLYSVSYGLKFACKIGLKRDYVVPPLQGLWWADDPAAFTERRKDEWRWTMMIMAPDFVDSDMFEAAKEKAAKKLGALPATLRLESYEEGLCLQRLHIGSYDEEGPVLHELHARVMPANGFTFNGPHHEIYLSDARKTPPEKLKTILRQPVRPA